MEIYPQSARFPLCIDIIVGIWESLWSSVINPNQQTTGVGELMSQLLPTL